MEKTPKTPQSAAQSSIECTRCHKNVAPADGKKMKKGFVCNDCQAKSKRNKIIAICAVLVCCAVGALTWYYVSSSEKRTASSFNGVSEINDSVNVQMDSINVEFNLATATITSAPVSTQTPVSNIEDFKRVLAQNVNEAKSSNTNSLSIPVSAVQFGFKSSILTPDAYNMIREIVSLYKQTSKENNIVVEGYACNIGKDAPNDYISKQRAEDEKAALIENGIDVAKITTHWYGKSKNSEFNLPKNEDNRRVLISIK